MAAPTNTLITNNAVGNRKSLHNIISILNKDETPFQAAIGSGSAEATYEEWQLDALGNADTTNAQLEGDDTTAAAIVPTSRVGNRTQILKKPFTISATQEVVKKAGRDSEISYQTALAGRRIKMDLEAIACQNQASGAQSGGTPRKMGGFEFLARLERLARRRPAPRAASPRATPWRRPTARSAPRPRRCSRPSSRRHGTPAASPTCC